MPAVVDAAVVHGAKRHRRRVVARAHDTVEIAHDDARVLEVIGHARHGERSGSDHHGERAGREPPLPRKGAVIEQHRARGERNPELVIAG